jgi:hypothetical protein
MERAKSDVQVPETLAIALRGSTKKSIGANMVIGIYRYPSDDSLASCV